MREKGKKKGEGIEREKTQYLKTHQTGNTEDKIVDKDRKHMSMTS